MGDTGMKKTLGIFLAAACILTTFSGCGHQVTLRDAFANNAKITSCSFDVSVSGDAGKLAQKSAGSLPSSLGSLSLDFNGKMQSGDSRVAMSGNCKYAAGGTTVTLPFWFDSSRQKYDFNVFLGIPDVLKSSTGGYFNNYKYIYLSSGTIDSYMKQTASAQDYEKYKSALSGATSKNSPAKAVSRDVENAFSDFIAKDKTGVQAATFKAIDNKPTDSNGIYTVKITKSSVKAFVGDYLGNAAYYQNFSAYIKSLGDDYAKNLKNEKDEIADVDKAIDSGMGDASTIAFTITDGYVTNISADLQLKNASETSTLKITIALTDINKSVTITAPSKTDPATLDASKLLGMLGSSSASSGATVES